jgi:hypothetical protein
MSNISTILNSTQKKALYFFKKYSLLELKVSIKSLDEKGELTDKEREIMNEAIEFHRVFLRELIDDTIPTS